MVAEIGTAVYETAVARGWIDDTDADYARGTPQRAALELLTRLGLLTYDEEARRFQPVDPAATSDQLVVPLAQRGSELLAESARWNSTMSRLGQIYRSSSLQAQRTTTEVHGIDAINLFIDNQLTE